MEPYVASYAGCCIWSIMSVYVVSRQAATTLGCQFFDKDEEDYISITHIVYYQDSLEEEILYLNGTFLAKYRINKNKIQIRFIGLYSFVIIHLKLVIKYVFLNKLSSGILVNI